MKLLVKICGLSTPGSLDWALAAGADMVGFVHFPKSPRHVAPELAGRLAEAARGRARTVLLTVDASDALLDGLVRQIAPDLLQLHGHETPERVIEVKTRYSLPVIKAIGIGSAEDAAGVADFDGAADYLLLDAKPPKEATRPGGLGIAFDWGLIADLRPSVPVLLSGGLGPTNVAEAVNRVRPAGVDVSSGVETAPGIKDRTKIIDFVAAARTAAQAAGASET